MLKRLFKLAIRLLIILIFAALGIACYQYFIAQKGYPSEMTLYDQNLRSLKIKLEGRTPTQIHFTRIRDNRSFTYPIKDLHKISQMRVKLYPEIPYPNHTEEKSLTEIHIEQTIEARDRLLAEVKELAQATNEGESEVHRRSIYREMERKIAKAKDLERNLSMLGAEYERSCSDVESGIAQQFRGLFQDNSSSTQELDSTQAP